MPKALQRGPEALVDSRQNPYPAPPPAAQAAQQPQQPQPPQPPAAEQQAQAAAAAAAPPPAATAPPPAAAAAAALKIDVNDDIHRDDENEEEEYEPTPRVAADGTTITTPFLCLQYGNGAAGTGKAAIETRTAVLCNDQLRMGTYIAIKTNKAIQV